MKNLVFISALLLATINQVGCFFSIPCEDEIKNESKSLDGKYVITFYERDCGATTDYYRRVNIRDSALKFDPDKVEDIVFVVKGRYQVSFVWKDDRTVQIACVDCLPNDIIKQERLWKDVQIVY